MIFWVICVIIVSALLFVTYQQRFSRIGRIISKIPGPDLVLFFGNSFEFGRNPVEFFNEILQAVTKHGSIVRYWFVTFAFILISGPEDIECILSSSANLKKGIAYELLHGWLGSGLVTADGGKKWYYRRKMLTPAFHFKILEKFIDVFNQNAYILIKKLKIEVASPGFDVEPYVSYCTLDIICESAMGTAVNAQLDSEPKFADAIKNVSSATIYRSFKPWLFPQFCFDISPTGRSYHQSLKYIHDFVNQVIQKKKMLHKEGKKEKVDTYGTQNRYALLDLMLQYSGENKDLLSDRDICDEVNTFMFAGHDTTTSGVAFTIYALANHPQFQEESVKELRDIFVNSDRDATYQDLQRMKFLERIIKESLRLYSPVPMIARELTHDVNLPSGYTLPRGASVTLFLYKMHHDPEIFPNPEEFNPDNFLPERVQNRPPYAYCPFSAGPRNCIGQKFALFEMKAILSCLLRHYRLLSCQPKPGILLSSELVLRPANGVHIQIEKRI